MIDVIARRICGATTCCRRPITMSNAKVSKRRTTKKISAVKARKSSQRRSFPNTIARMSPYGLTISGSCWKKK